MTISIFIFGSLILLAGVLLLINPEIIFGFLRSYVDHSAIHVTAVVVRLIIGALLVSQSDISRFPLTIEILGWVLIFAGFLLAVIGCNKFHKLMSWALTGLMPFGRLAGVMAIAFGGFLVYAFL